MEKLKDWLIAVVGGLVDHPEKVEITFLEDEQGILFSIHVDREDVGRVIGKKGIIAEALRTLLRSAGFRKTEQRVSMKIVAPGSNFEPKNHDEQS